MRGATYPEKVPVPRPHFNPRTPCGVRPWEDIMERMGYEFQSTHPLRGATSSASAPAGFPPQFQSTHPLRGATAPDGRCDGATGHFNPRTPCGVRLEATKRHVAEQAFQSTHPLRGATTFYCKRSYLWHNFNPRTPCGVRLMSAGLEAVQRNFNPRTPCGVRPAGAEGALTALDFNPRTPCGVRLLPP